MFFRFFFLFFFFNRTTQCDYWFFVSTLYSLLFSILLARHRKKKKDKKITAGHKRIADFVFSECVHEKTPCIGFLSLLFTGFYFQFCLQDTEKKKKKNDKKITGRHKRMADFVFFFRMCA